MKVRQYSKAMRFLFVKSWLNILSGLFVNLSASWLTLAFITPKISKSFPDLLISLTNNIAFGIFFLVLAVEIESNIQNG